MTAANRTTQVDAMVAPNWLDFEVREFPAGVDPLAIVSARMEVLPPSGSSWLAWDCTVHALTATTATFRHVFATGDNGHDRGKYAVRVWYDAGGGELLSGIDHFMGTKEF